jgi:serine/threonine protein phosphatase 1
LKKLPHHIYLPANTQGRDFAVGDIHMEYGKLKAALKAAGFDESKDRLFSVGDLIGREGRELEECIKLLDEPWFHVVEGNHEMALVEASRHSMSLCAWRSVQNESIKAFSDNQLTAFAERLRDLPTVITIGKGENRINLVHAVMSNPAKKLMTDAQLDQVNFTWAQVCSFTEFRFLAAEHREQSRSNQSSPRVFEGLSLTLCGHSAVDTPTMVASHYLLDTGCGRLADANYLNPRVSLVEIAPLLLEYQLALAASDFYRQVDEPDNENDPSPMG